MAKIRLANYSSFPFEGWKRTTVDTPLEHKAANMDDGTTVVLGRRIAPDLWAVDVWIVLAPGEHKVINTATMAPFDFVLSMLPDDIFRHFGGSLSVRGMDVGIRSLQQDGAGYMLHAWRRHSNMLCTFVWLLWYPDQPAWAIAEVLTVASYPADQDMGESLPYGVQVGFGDALVPNVVVMEGVYIADGQGKSTPLPLFWQRHARHHDLASFCAAASGGICAVGVERLLTSGTGKPLFPAGFNARQWATDRWQGAVSRLLTWDPPVCGPATISGSAGEQEETLLHAGGEALLPDGVGAEHVRYLAAIKLHAERPCNHVEANGDWLRPEDHPSLLFWDGRPHWHTGVSPDRLGKPRELTAEEAHGRWGPDVQHFYQHGLASAARLTGSPLCQQLLRNLCTVYLLQRTDNPSWSTSAWESAREWGCEGQFVQDVWLTLEDRAMAQRVIARWRSRVERILLPRMVGKDLLVTWQNDPRVNATGLGAQWWQESFASWSIDETCRVVGPSGGRLVALSVAMKVLDVAWKWTGDHWRAQPQGPIDGSSNDQNPETDSFNHYGMPLCVAVVLRNDHAHTKARAIWQQLRAATAENSHRWMPPIDEEVGL